jgi:hypothetical protein
MSKSFSKLRAFDVGQIVLSVMLLGFYGWLISTNTIFFTSEDRRLLPPEVRAHSGGYRSSPAFWGGGVFGGK